MEYFNRSLNISVRHQIYILHLRLILINDEQNSVFDKKKPKKNRQHFVNKNKNI